MRIWILPSFLTSLIWLGLWLGLSLNALAGLMIPEVDPYRLLDADQKKQELKIENKKIAGEIQYLTCTSAKEFQLTYEELKKQDLVSLSERDQIYVAYEVSKGCVGAHLRFQKIFTILVKSGVDKKKSIQIALHFALKTPEQTEAFLLVFKGSFLEKYMDLDFKSALATSLNLALNIKGNPQNAAEDFREILDYCLTHKTTGLPYKVCAPYTLQLAKYSHHYPSGMKKSFTELMVFFAEQKEIEYSMAKSLKLSAKLLRKGPQAVENFYEQFRYAVSEKMRLPAKAAIELAVKVAENSLREE